VCLCDAFSRTQHSARPSPRASPSFKPRAVGAETADVGAGDADADVEPSDVDVQYTLFIVFFSFPYSLLF